MPAPTLTDLIIQLIPIAVVTGLAVIYLIASVRILNRTGYSGWWSLLVLIPVVNVIALWKFSKARWPAIEPPVK
jgi:uncharacterized membrane protein YhaH (DUF805 family)